MDIKSPSRKSAQIRCVSMDLDAIEPRVGLLLSGEIDQNLQTVVLLKLIKDGILTIGRRIWRSHSSVRSSTADQNQSRAGQPSSHRLHEPSRRASWYWALRKNLRAWTMLRDLRSWGLRLRQD